MFIGVGLVRGYKVLTRQAPPNAFPGDTPHGSSLDRRVSRAHLNCAENLPIFGVVVVVGHLVGLTDGVFATLAIVSLGGRVLQSSAHIVGGSSFWVMVRAGFFLVQIACWVYMGGLIAQVGVS
jgi:uncharacterized MAPEG superfamily protein